jgi:hypothetical protein
LAEKVEEPRCSAPMEIKVLMGGANATLNTDRRRTVPGTDHYSFLSTATSSILFNGEAQGQRTGVGEEAVQEKPGNTIEGWTSIETLF